MRSLTQLTHHNWFFETQQIYAIHSMTDFLGKNVETMK